MKLNYCTECAAPLTQLDSTTYRCANGHKYYNNPHAACSVIFMNDKHEVLFSKRGREPQKGKYDFPGGFLNYDEDPYQAAVREVSEEMSVQLNAGDLLLLDSSLNEYEENDTSCDFAFLCRHWQGEIKPNDDVAQLEWKPIDFIQSTEFAWPYPYLYNKLQSIVHHELSGSNQR